MTRITYARWRQRSTFKVIRSRRQSDACSHITRQRKVAQAPTLAGRLSLPWVTLHTSSKVKSQRSRSPDGYVLYPKISHWNGNVYELRTWYTDGTGRPILTCAVICKLKALDDWSVIIQAYNTHKEDEICKLRPDLQPVALLSRPAYFRVYISDIANPDVKALALHNWQRPCAWSRRWAADVAKLLLLNKRWVTSSRAKYGGNPANRNHNSALTLT